MEDFEPYRRFVTTTLKQMQDLRVICEVSDGLEAVQKAKELQPDLIVLDIGLPRLNGIEAARRIRAIGLRSRILFFSENRSLDRLEKVNHQREQNGALLRELAEVCAKSA